MYRDIVWLQTVLRHDSLHAKHVCYVSSIPGYSPVRYSTRQQHMRIEKRICQGISFVCLLRSSTPRRVLVSYDRQSSEVNSWQSTLMNWVVALRQCFPSHIRQTCIASIFIVRQSYCARYWYRLDVCPSVCLSVTCWYCVETAQPIVKLSSLPGSPMILVFRGPNVFQEFQWEHPIGAINVRGRKSCNFRPISRYSS